MSQVVLIFKKEWLNFVRGDRGIFIVYLILVAGWGVLLATTHDDGTMAVPLWVVFFSVIVAVNFSSTVFVLERVSGSLEILLTCGISRSAILYGKMLFVVIMTFVIGAGCFACAVLVRKFISGPEGLQADILTWRTFALYAGATFLNAAGSAYFSVVLPNPRLLHFINLLIAGFVMTAYTAVSLIRPLPPEIAAAALVLLGIVFTALARREFESERIVKPVVL
jgi:ABC-type transport system involved in multi-copper enzyme maturation permease subunit